MRRNKNLEVSINSSNNLIIYSVNECPDKTEKSQTYERWRKGRIFILL